MKQIKAIVTSKIMSESDSFEINGKKFKYGAEILLTEQEYTDIYSETIIDKETHLAKNIFDINVISIDDVEEPKNEEEIKSEITENIIIEEIELYNTVYANIKNRDAAVAVYKQISQKLQRKEYESQSESE